MSIKHQKEDQMKKKTTTLLAVAQKAHLDGNRNAHTDDEALISVEGFRNGWVTIFRRGIGPEFISRATAATMTVTDLGRRK